MHDTPHATPQTTALPHAASFFAKAFSALPVPKEWMLNAIQPLPALFQTRIATLACQAINHLFVLEPMVQAHLTPHVGRTVLLRWETIGLAPAGEQALRIQDDLTLAACLENNPARIDVTISIQAGILTASAEQRLRFVRLEGDVLLAQALSTIAQQLRWDAEHDLARFVGDVPAYWIVHNAKHAAAVLQAAADVLKTKLAGAPA